MEGAKGREDSMLMKGEVEQWTLYVVNASNDTGSRADMMLFSPKGCTIHCAMCFNFMASNNDTKYEALLVGLHLASELQAHNVKIFSNS